MHAFTVSSAPSMSQTSAMQATIRPERAATWAPVLGLEHQEEELVAAAAAHRVAGADHPLESLRHHLQHPVARVVPVRVVDGLEAVEIDEHHREPPGVPLGLRQGDAEPVIEESQVRQARHGVVQSAVSRAPLCGPAPGQRGVAPRELLFEATALVDLGGQHVVDGDELGRRFLDVRLHDLALIERALDLHEGIPRPPRPSGRR